MSKLQKITTPPRKRHSNSEGFTLVEVVAASLILAIAVGGVLSCLVHARYLARVAAHRAQAIQVARSNIEALRYSLGYADAALQPAGSPHTNMPSDVPHIVEVAGQTLNVDYIPHYTVVESNMGFGFSYKIIGFEVEWVEPLLYSSITHTVRVNTIIASAMDR